jgi:cytochrome P450 family 142 subfamily A polypeptide 1
MVELADINLVSGDFWGRNPHEELAWLRRHDPVYWDEQGQVWGITRYEHIKQVSKDPATFSSAGGIRPDAPPLPMMIDMDDPAHWNRRKLVNRGFTPARVRDQEAKVRSLADLLIDRVIERGECDFVWDLAAWLPLAMIGDALGVDPNDHSKVLEWSDNLMRALGAADPTLVERAMTTFMEYDEYARRIIEDRRATPRDDLLSILVHAEVDGDRLTEDDIVHESLLILIGGDETTRHVITGGAYQLLTHPEQWQRLLDDRALLPSAVEEMLRWVSPIKNMKRTATRDVDFAGKQIRQGDGLLLLYPSANRDEDTFVDPDTFNIERHPNDHVAFGFGSHFCLGNSLARLELQVMFEQLLTRLPDLRLVETEEPSYRPANFVSGYETMKVAFSPR